jgi:hypothetical protein
MTSEDAPPMETLEIEGRLTRFIEQELLGPGATVGRRDDLLSGELLDSVAVLRLAAFVEQELRVPMRPADFVVDNFRDVAVLAEYVLREGRRAE